MDATEAVRQAYHAHYRRLVAQLYGLTGSFPEAEDVVQEAYARALTRPARFLAVANPEGWLRRTAFNVARTRYRRRWLFDQLARSRRIGVAEQVPGVSPDRVALVAALARLNRGTREAVILHHLADLSVEDVAENLGVPVGTVKARLSRGRAQLARHLADDAAAHSLKTRSSHV